MSVPKAFIACGVGPTDRERTRRGVVERDRVGGHRLDLPRQNFGREALLLDGARAPRLGHLARVRGLVIVGRRRERDEDRRAAGGGQLGNRRGTRAADHQMRIAQFLGHVLDVGRELGRDTEVGVALAHVVDVVGTALLDDLQAVPKRGLEQPQARGHDLAQHHRTLASAGDENLQRRDFVERRERKLAETRDFLAHRVADEHRLGSVFALEAIELLERRGDRGRIAGEQAIDPAEHRILFMQHGRDAHRAGGEQRGECGIAAEPDDRVGPVLAIKRFRPRSALQHRTRGLEPADRPAAEPPGRQNLHRNVLEQAGEARSAPVGDQQDSVPADLQFRRKRVGRDHVATGAPGSEYEVHAVRLSPLHLTT
jgi:hypothetical protein